MTKRTQNELAALIDDITVDASGDDEQLSAFHEAFKNNLLLPITATIVGQPVQVTKFNYDGNARRGLTATCLGPDGSIHEVSAVDLTMPAGSLHERHVNAYRQGLGIEPPAKSKIAQRNSTPAPSPRQLKKALTSLPAIKETEPPAEPRPSGGGPTQTLSTAVNRADDSLDVAILSLTPKAAHCRLLHSEDTFTLRTGRLSKIVPGQIATVQVTKRWTNNGQAYLSGTIESMRLDVKGLGLVPLRLNDYGLWDPAEHYWGEPKDPIEAWAQPIIARGPRPQFEMEQVLPGLDPADPWSDPIGVGNDLNDAGDGTGAYDAFMRLCRADLRCLDAHAHLGNLSFPKRPQEAIQHYEVGVRIGELSLADNFQGVLPWGHIDNRPFLRCLHGYGLCLWRLGRFEECTQVFDGMLWLNPTDNQGVRFMIDEVRSRKKWKDSC